jgi:hypothetical protein
MIIQIKESQMIVEKIENLLKFLSISKSLDPLNPGTLESFGLYVDWW